MAIWAAMAHADTFSGRLDPATNPNLVAWNWDPLNPVYVAPIAGPSDADRAYNIAVHSFAVAAPAAVSFSSLGYGLGGFDSVVSVFQGSGNSAVYLHHELSPLPVGDFTFDLNLIAGNYTLAVSMYLNEPCADGFCFVNGEFGDGFTNLVNFDPFDPSRTDPLFYKVEVTGNVAPVPEPSLVVVVALGMAGIVARRRLVRRKGA